MFIKWEQASAAFCVTACRNPIISPAGSCTYAVKSYPTYLADEPEWASRAEKVAARMQDLTSFIVNKLGVVDVGASLQGRAVYHPSCSLARKLGVKDEPLTLLKNVRGLELLTFAEHKGYALAAMCEILGGALSGGKTTHQETLQTSPDAILNCMTTIIINPELFGAPDCSAQTEAFAEWVKASPHDDDKPILLPGEWEVNTRRERQEQGIPLDAGSWQAICDAARQIGMSEETLQGFCQQLAS